jgi:hypothetical protein
MLAVGIESDGRCAQQKLTSRYLSSYALTYAAACAANSYEDKLFGIKFAAEMAVRKIGNRISDNFSQKNYRPELEIFTARVEITSK